MIVTLIKEEEIYEKILPNKIIGKYWLCDTYNNKLRDLISIEPIDGKWHLVSNFDAYIVNSINNKCSEIELEPMKLYNINVSGEMVNSYVYCEESDTGRQSFTKLFADSNFSITFGNTGSDTICYSLPILNGSVFSLTNKGTHWEIVVSDQNSIVYVNNKKVSQTKLNIGDVIYVLGFKMVLGDNYIAINNPNKLVSYNEGILRKIPIQICNKNDNHDIYIKEEPMFFKSPRFINPIKKTKLKIDSPPEKQKIDEIPFALSVGPSLMMGLTSVMTSGTSILNMESERRTFLNLFPTLLMSGSMLMTSVLFPVITNKYNKKLLVKKEKERQNKYTEYLESKKNELLKLKEEQKNTLINTYRSFGQLANIIDNKTSELWSKAPDNLDFLSSYIGVGNIPAELEIESNEKQFSMEDDNLKEMVYNIKDTPQLLENVPIYYSFSENYITGVTGDLNLIFNFMQNVILELSTFHGYDDVKIVFIGNELDAKKWCSIRWLPHIWDNDRKIRFFASNSEELAIISDYFNNLISEDELIDETGKVKKKLKENYIIIFTDKNMFEQCEFVKKVLSADGYFGISLITLFGNYANLPRECNSIIDIRNDVSSMYTKKDNKLLKFNSNCAIAGDNLSYYKKLFNIKLNISTNNNVLPNSISFLEMYNSGKIDYLNVLSRWTDNDPTISLKAPVGVNSYGELFYIDLHEKYHGPHGLIAGGTGSGKSEFIITFILSLAVNYHPDEVSFVLIDYKGGGLTGAFEVGDSGKKLPHLSGTITNLSGSSIKRCIISIKSELQRRQKIFNEARKVSGEGTIDIYKYQKLRRQGIVKDAVPHLYIISDEFAELKSQQPEFMDELISTARIGRSLGVHLILATQKPAGVVDEQIWSNTKFRVCLKVQDKADSMDMIRRPDAAELVQTGRFYFQVGYNELFAMGQSAWSGAEYIPCEKIDVSGSKVVKLINNIGTTQYEVKPKNSVVVDKKYSQQVVEIVKHLAEIAEKENITPLSLWMEPLPSSILLKKLIKKYSYKTGPYILNPIIGEYDDPSTQSQHILTMPISEGGNCAIYGAVGSGKTTMLSTIIYSLITNISSENLNVYVMDFGTGFLKIFDKAPQVGDVILQEDEEKIENLFKMLEKEIVKRKSLFAQYGGDINNYRKFSNKSISNLLIIINNFAVFAEEYELLAEKLKNLLRDGIKYGITFILTGTDSGSISYNFTQNIRLNYALQMNNADDYSYVLGKNNNLVPSAVPGRGLVKLGDNIFEFQTALLEYNDNIMSQILDVCNDLSSKAKVFAEPIPTLPKNVNFEYFEDKLTDIKKIPIGVSKDNLSIKYMNFGIYPTQLITSEIIKNTYSTTKELVKIISKVSGVYPFVFDVANKLKIESNDKVYVANDTTFSSRINYVYNEYLKRKEAYESSGNDVSSLSKNFHMVCVFCGLSNMMDMISFEDKAKLDEILSIDKLIYKINILIIDESGSLNNFNIERWYQNMINNSPIIWIGRGLSEQYSIKANGRIENEINNNFGYVIEDGIAELVKVLEYKKIQEETLEF